LSSLKNVSAIIKIFPIFVLSILLFFIRVYSFLVRLCNMGAL
jgi:hypothetical protein